MEIGIYLYKEHKKHNALDMLSIHVFLIMGYFSQHDSNDKLAKNCIVWGDTAYFVEGDKTIKKIYQFKIGRCTKVYGQRGFLAPVIANQSI